MATLQARLIALAQAIGGDIKALTASVYTKTQSDANYAAKVHTQAFSTLTSTPTTVAGYGITDAYTRLGVQSRGMNLVTNGTGLMGSNFNFSAFSFYTTDTYSGGGSFSTGAARDFSAVTDENIPIVPSLFYTIKMALKSLNLQANNSAYVYITQLDIDGQVIAPIHVSWDDSTMTSLAAPLKVGDTTITLTSAANWAAPKGYLGTQAFAEAISVIKIHAFKNLRGFSWPTKTYSRNVSGYAPYSYSTGVNTSTNVITLRTPWAVANPDSAAGWPVGTPIGVSYSAGTYMYPTNVSNTPIPDTGWTQASAVIGGSVQTDGQPAVGTRFYYGAAFIKIGVLANRMFNTASAYPSPSNTTLISGVYLSEINVQNLAGGSAGYTGTVNTGTKTFTVVNGIITAVV